MNADILRKGKALVMAIQGLQAVEIAEVEIGEAVRQSQVELAKIYQRRLREIIANASPEEAGEIMSAMATAKLPLRDAGAN